MPLSDYQTWRVQSTPIRAQSHASSPARSCMPKTAAGNTNFLQTQFSSGFLPGTLSCTAQPEIHKVKDANSGSVLYQSHGINFQTKLQAHTFANAYDSTVAQLLPGRAASTCMPAAAPAAPEATGRSFGSLNRTDQPTYVQPPVVQRTMRLLKSEEAARVALGRRVARLEAAAAKQSQPELPQMSERATASYIRSLKSNTPAPQRMAATRRVCTSLQTSPSQPAGSTASAAAGNARARPGTNTTAPVTAAFHWRATAPSFAAQHNGLDLSATRQLVEGLRSMAMDGAQIAGSGSGSISSAANTCDDAGWVESKSNGQDTPQRGQRSSSSVMPVQPGVEVTSAHSDASDCPTANGVPGPIAQASSPAQVESSCTATAQPMTHQHGAAAAASLTEYRSVQQPQPQHREPASHGQPPPNTHSTSSASEVALAAKALLQQLAAALASVTLLPPGDSANTIHAALLAALGWTSEAAVHLEQLDALVPAVHRHVPSLAASATAASSTTPLGTSPSAGSFIATHAFGPM